MAREPAGVACYVDTSALFKRYVGEAGSEAFDAFCELSGIECFISALVVTEFTGVLQRRVRMGALTRRQSNAVRQSFLSDVAAGGWQTIQFGVDIFSRASQLMLHLASPLATLDALHLATALQHGATGFATADRQLAAAAREAKLHLHLF